MPGLTDAEGSSETTPCSSFRNDRSRSGPNNTALANGTLMRCAQRHVAPDLQ
jgi:hypothetical protein